MSMDITSDPFLERDALLKIGLISCLLEIDDVFGWTRAVEMMARLMNEPWTTASDQCISALHWFQTHMDGHSELQVDVFLHVLEAFYESTHFYDDDDDDEVMA